MKVLVTGVGGQLGFDVMNELAKRGYEGVGSDILKEAASIDAPYVQMDITDREAVLKNIKEIKPDAVIHCAACLISLKITGRPHMTRAMTGFPVFASSDTSFCCPSGMAIFTLEAFSPL